MDDASMLALKGMHLAPYIQVATALIGKSRYGGGNMFRHQMDTLAILIDYGYVDPVLLKASIIHDVVEDIPEYDRGLLGSIDDDAPEVVELVLEVSRRPGEGKADYLKRVAAQGSARAKILKVADRISNVVSLGFVTDALFVERYIKETEAYVLPIALEADPRMAKELADLLASRSSCGG